MEINDNFFNTDESLAALCTLIKDATNLEHVSIDSSDIDDEERTKQVMEALVETQSKDTLYSFNWSYDAFEQDDFIEELLGLLGNGLFTVLEFVELAETMDDKKKRNKWRNTYKEKGISLILSDR